MNISRRTLLTGAMAGGALALGGHPTSGLAASTASTTPYNPATETLQLNKIATSRGLTFGSPFTPYLQPWNLPGNASNAWLSSPYTQLYKRQCGIITCLYQWNGLEPTQGNFVPPTYKDSISNFWLAQGMKLRCHALVWYAALPPWFANLPSRTAGIDAINNHIQTLLSTRSTWFHSIDVVNEALYPQNGLPGGLRASPLTQVIGTDWMGFAFEAARAAAPNAILVYNDYNTEITGSYDLADTKRATTLAMIDNFQANKIPIDAIGIQSHMFYAQWQYFNAQAFAAYLAAIAQRGLKIFITENDTVDVGTPTNVSQRDKVIAQVYQTYLQTALANPAVKVVETWGLCDPESWQLSMGTNAQFYRTDGTAPRPLPFDSNYMPKPAAQAIATALTNAPSR